MDGLFVDSKYAGRPTSSDALDFLYPVIASATNPFQTRLQKASGHKTGWHVCVPAPTHRAAIDEIQIMIIIVFHIRDLIAELGENPGHCRQADLDLCALGQYSKGQVACSCQSPESLKAPIEGGPAAAQRETPTSSRAINIKHTLIQVGEIRKVEFPFKVIWRKIFDVLLQSFQIEYGVEAVSPHNLLHCLQVDAGDPVGVVIATRGNTVSHANLQRRQELLSSLPKLINIMAQV